MLYSHELISDNTEGIMKTKSMGLIAVLTLTFAAGSLFAADPAAPNKAVEQSGETGMVKTGAAPRETKAVTEYDFTTGSDKYYGGASGAKDLGDGNWGMAAGDANGDGGVYAEDYTAYRTNQGNEGYEAADFNLDGGVYAEDYTIYRLNQGDETQVP